MKVVFLSLLLISFVESAIVNAVKGKLVLVDLLENPNINPIVNIERPIQINNEEVVDIGESEDKKEDSVIVWDAEEGDIYDFYDSPNWDFSESDLKELDRDSVIASILTITDAKILEDSPSFSPIEIGNGFSLTLKSTSFTFQNSNGFAGVDDNNDVASTLNIFEGSSMDAMFSTMGLQINVDSTSRLTLRGAADPINSHTERSIVNLYPNAQLTLNSLSEFTEQGDDIYLNGVSFSQNPAILKFNGNTGTAIPEGSSVLLAGISAFLLLSAKKRL